MARFRVVWPPERRLVGEIVIDELLDSGNESDKQPLLTVRDQDGTLWQYRAPRAYLERWTAKAVRVEIVEVKGATCKSG